MSLVLISFKLPEKGIPSTTISASLPALSDLSPRMRIWGTAPGWLFPPDICTSTPAASPCKAEARLATGARLIISLLTFTIAPVTVSYTHLRAHETRHDLVCRLLLEKK